MQATVGEDTTIQETVEVALGDLTLGTRVNVGGARGEDGTFQAQTIVAVPEGQQGPGGFAAGEISQEDLDQFRQQFQGQFGQGGGSGAFGGGGARGGGGFGGRTAGGGGLSGTLESVDQDVITINTDQGPLPVAIGEDTTIRKTVEVALADLTEGTRVTVLGARSESGDVEARSIGCSGRRALASGSSSQKARMTDWEADSGEASEAVAASARPSRRITIETTDGTGSIETKGGFNLSRPRPVGAHLTSSRVRLRGHDARVTTSLAATGVQWDSGTSTYGCPPPRSTFTRTGGWLSSC